MQAIYLLIVDRLSCMLNVPQMAYTFYDPALVVIMAFTCLYQVHGIAVVLYFVIFCCTLFLLHLMQVNKDAFSSCI